MAGCQWTQVIGRTADNRTRGLDAKGLLEVLHCEQGGHERTIVAVGKGAATSTEHGACGQKYSTKYSQ